MKRFAFVLALLVLGVSATSAAAGTTKSQSAQLAALQHQVSDLAAQVKALQKQVKTLQATEKAFGGNLIANFYADACLAALTADALQGSWAVIDQVIVASGKPAVFGPQAPVVDKGSCANLIPPITRSAAVPPTVAQLSALIAWYRP
jgi:outer membrane murein-binding lipoprotein Lpp